MITLALAAMLVVPVAGSASSGKSDPGGNGALVPASLLANAAANPLQMFDVIVQGDKGSSSSAVADEVNKENGSSMQRFMSVDGVEASISGKDLLKLARHPHVSAITPNVAVHTSAYEDATMWQDSTDLTILQNAFDPDFDDDNEVYAINTVAFHFMYKPVRVRRGELVRIYLVNIVEIDPINSFHIHGNFFHRFPTGTSLQPTEYTDTVVQGQGQRDVLELRFPYTGQYMFHAHKTEFASLGWMGMFEVVE